MRAAAAIACLAVLALAGPPADGSLAGRVEELVEQLGSPSEAARRAAHAELATLGDRAVPLLLHADLPTPAVAHRVDALLAGWRRLKLDLVSRELRLPASIGLRLRAVLRNDSRDFWRLPLDRAGRPLVGGLTVVAESDPPAVAIVDDARVTVTSTLPPGALLPPGAEMEFEVALLPGESPVRSGGTHRVRIECRFEAERFPFWLVEPGSTELPGEPAWSDMVPVALSSDPCTVVLEVRTPGELEEALLSTDRGTRGLALLELQSRSEAGLLPLLRRFANRPDVRPVAVERLGEAARPEDYDFLERVAKDEDAGEMRLAAIRALGRYRTEDARWALMGLANRSGTLVRLGAVEALVRHVHPQTVQCFIQLLRVLDPAGEAASVRVIRRTLHEWTGIDVAGREEVPAFERWWRENRAAWERGNADLIRPRDG